MASPVSVESLAPGNARYQVPDSRMECSDNEATTPVGVVMKQDTGVVWHKFKKGRNWEHAVYHSLIRRHLIDFEKTKGSFDIEPVSGREEDDNITSYHVDQKTWGPKREDFPEILFVYDRPQATKGQASTQFMYFNRMLVLDKDHRPVKAFPELNSTLSSKAEAFRLEAITRSNLKITSRDILARMPSQITTMRGAHANVRSQSKGNALSMRRREFRANNGFLSWIPREGSREIKTLIDGLIGPNLVALNNTRGMRPLTANEVDRILSLGKGTHPERSRHKGSESSPAAQGSVEKRQSDKHEKGEALQAEVLTGTEDHSERISPDPNEHEALGLGVPADSTGALLGPLNSSNIDDESSAIQSSPPVADLNFEDNSDRRNHIPLNYREMQIIAGAMAPTIQHYRDILNAGISFDTSAFRHESYNVQWSTMQEALERGWSAGGRLPQECPQLTRYERWEADMWDL